MRSIYEQLKMEDYDVQWGRGVEVYGRDFKIACNLPSIRIPQQWRNCIYVPHSVSEFFPYNDPAKWPFKFKGVLTAGLKTDKKIRGHPLCDSHNVKMVGWPKGDILFQPHREEIAEQLKESLNLPNEKTILVVCAAMGHLHWETSILDKITSDSKRKFNILIKKRLEKCPHLPPQGRHIRHIELTEDITPYYLVSDLLLSVHPFSSTVTEICQVNKPSISVNFLGKDWKKPYQFMYFGEPDVLCNLWELKSNITMLLKDSTQYDDKRKKQLADFFYKPDGHATERAVKEIKAWIKNEVDDPQ